MKTTNSLGPRPEANLISFSDDCFAVVGTKTTYSVVTAAPAYPRDFGADKASAEAFAAKTGRAVTETTHEIKSRVRWY